MTENSLAQYMKIGGPLWHPIPEACHSTLESAKQHVPENENREWKHDPSTLWVIILPDPRNDGYFVLWRDPRHRGRQNWNDWQGNPLPIIAERIDGQWIDYQDPRHD